MKTKFFTLFAAFTLLFGAKAMAQTNGDVNEDGVVNEQDITAIIQIMQEAGGVKEQTKYYWYVGQENPAELATSFNPGDNLANDYNSGGGWYLLGNEVPATIQQLVKGGDATKYWYTAVPITTPTTLTPVATDMITLNTAADKVTIKEFNGIKYQVYEYPGAVSARNTFRFALK